MNRRIIEREAASNRKNGIGNRIQLRLPYSAPFWPQPFPFWSRPHPISEKSEDYDLYRDAVGKLYSIHLDWDTAYDCTPEEIAASQNPPDIYGELRTDYDYDTKLWFLTPYLTYDTWDDVVGTQMVTNGGQLMFQGVRAYAVSHGLRSEIEHNWRERPDWVRGWLKEQEWNDACIRLRKHSPYDYLNEQTWPPILKLLHEVERWNRFVGVRHYQWSVNHSPCQFLVLDITLPKPNYRENWPKAYSAIQKLMEFCIAQGVEPRFHRE